LRALLKAGADVNSVDAFGTTALHRAAMHAQVKAIKVLLAAGADPNVKDQSGRTPRQWASDAAAAQVLLQAEGAG
jgi:ankyrin repeat protein